MKDKIQSKSKLEEIIRVDHAGEFGAKRIYQGQLAILKGHKEIKHMLEQELEHLDYFTEQVRSRRVRPTVLQPLWHVLGFALGAGTALFGEKAAMACTVAVEEVIDEHYQRQLLELQNQSGETELCNKIEQFRQEELEHRDTGLDCGAEDAPFYRALSGFVKRASKAAIFLSKKI